MSEEEGQYGYPLTGEELRDTIAKPPKERVQYFIDRCTETGQVWTVGADDDLVVLATDDDEPFVVAFPHPDFAQDWFTTTDLEDVDLVAIATNDWAHEILPGLQEANIAVLVFPTSEGSGALAEPVDLAELFAAPPSTP
jgi:hypothetical protein